VNIELLYITTYSYILGSIPFGLVLTKIFLKKDIREVGSGNIGATNVFRTGKKILGLATLTLDGIKSYVSIFITLIYFPDYMYLSALSCFLGHIFPIEVFFFIFAHIFIGNFFIFNYFKKFQHESIFFYNFGYCYLYSQKKYNSN
jgi:acyl-phosphate glycerol 3-phosphate acyltransferase